MRFPAISRADHATVLVRRPAGINNSATCASSMRSPAVHLAPIRARSSHNRARPLRHAAGNRETRPCGCSIGRCGGHIPVAECFHSCFVARGRTASCAIREDSAVRDARPQPAITSMRVFSGKLTEWTPTPGTEFFDRETGSLKAANQLTKARTETRKTANAPRIRGKTAANLQTVKL